jgi:hypothetical protein
MVTTRYRHSNDSHQVGEVAIACYQNDFPRCRIVHNMRHYIHWHLCLNSVYAKHTDPEHTCHHLICYLFLAVVRTVDK